MVEVNQQAGEVGGVGVSGESGGHGNTGLLVNNLNDTGPGMGKLP
jgi:hypothetical protein